MKRSKDQKVHEENIITSEYSEEMQRSYINYAMSVIIARAIPDVRDGLKPVQRRTLYDMHQLGIRYDRPYRKSARIVGDTMGKYHPHGDSSIYDSLVVMSQDFKKGIPMVDGHGNFGSIEGDPPAAMRYTEARLQKITQEYFLADLDKDVVDFMPNFDETEKEPTVLPVRIPNILVNGSEGIAVGMTTSIPTHNLGEVIDGVKALIENSDITDRELMKYIKGPDFPTGGIVVNEDELPEIYKTGQGRIKLRGRVEYEKGKGGRDYLVITEIPYTMIGANIGKFLNDIYALVESRATTDITDISNQSSKEGIRIVLELRKNTDIENLKNLLYKKTKLQDTFAVNMLTVCDGKPKVLSLRGILENYLDFQYEVTTRKYRSMLNKELEKKEIQEGLIKACDVIDLIIEILRGSRSRQQARDCLVLGETKDIRFKSKDSKDMASLLHFTERQADAILDMRLYKLIGLEIEALQKEHDQTLANIAEYRDILENFDSMNRVILKELAKIKKEFAVPRKTAIENAEEIVLVEKPVEAVPIHVLIDRFGYIRSVDDATYERNKETAEAESRFSFASVSTDRICVFSDAGNMYIIKNSDIPFGKFRDKAQPIDNISGFDASKESIVMAAPFNEITASKLLFVTNDGFIKLVDGSEFNAITRKSILASKLNDDARLVTVLPVGNASSCALITDNEMVLKMSILDVPEKKKTAIGVRGIKLKKGASVTQGALCIPGADNIVTAGDTVISLNDYRNAGRDTTGKKLKK